MTVFGPLDGQRSSALPRHLARYAAFEQLLAEPP